MELLGLEGRVPIEVVGQRLAQVLLDGRRQAQAPAQHVAGAEAQHHARALRPVAALRERGAPFGGMRIRIGAERDRGHGPHDGNARLHGGLPQRGVVAGEGHDRTHPPARDGRAQRLRQQRIELAAPPLPEVGQAESARGAAQARGTRRQGEVTFGHDGCIAIA